VRGTLTRRCSRPERLLKLIDALARRER